MLCFCGFSANIISTLSSSRSLNNYNELIEYKPIEVAVSFFKYFQTAMRESQDTHVKTMMSRYDGYKSQLPCEHNSVACDNTISNLIANGQSAMAMGGPDDYIFDKDVFDFMNSRPLSCALTYYEIPMGVQLMTYGLRKNLPYKKDIDIAIMRLKETGLLTKMLHDFYPHPPDCSDIASNPYKSVSFVFVYSAYYLLFSGYAVAVSIFFLEKMYVSFLTE